MYSIILILYSSITIINNELRSQNVHISLDGEIVINDPVQSLSIGTILFAQICLIIVITLIILSLAISINIMIKLKKAAQDSIEGQQIYSSLIPYSFASIVLFGFIVSFFLWIKSVKISKKLENYYGYIYSLSLNESDSDDNNDYETFQQDKVKKKLITTKKNNMKLKKWKEKHVYYENQNSYYNNQTFENNQLYDLNNGNSSTHNDQYNNDTANTCYIFIGEHLQIK